MANCDTAVKRVAIFVVLMFCFIGWVMVPTVKTERINSFKKHQFLAEILAYIGTFYVDPIPADSLLDGALRGILKTSRLDGTGIFLTFKGDTMVVHETTPPYSNDIGPIYELFMVSYRRDIIFTYRRR